MSSVPASGFISPAALLRIRSLELRARAVMEGFWKGLHRSPNHGFSAEFSEYRPYARGDDPRFIDWKVAARTDRWYVKKFEEETNLRCQVVLDGSASMGYGSQGYSKGEYAATLAATLALFLMQQGDAPGLTVFDDRVLDHVPARRRPGQLHALLMHLQRALDRAKGSNGRRGATQPLAGVLSPVGQLLRRRALIVIVSDFLTPLDGLESGLALFRALGHEVILAQVLDPAEIEFPFAQPGAFEDVESGKRFVLDPQRARENYLRRFAAHGDELRALCARQNAGWRLARTDVPLEHFLFEYLSARRHSGAGQGARRRASGAVTA